MAYFAPDFRRADRPRDGRRCLAVNVTTPGERNRLGIQQLTLRFALRLAQRVALRLGVWARFSGGDSGLGMMGLRYAPG